MHKRSPGRKTTNKLLVVVYGLKTTDYTYLDLFYPARRLAQEAANRGISLRFLFPSDLPGFLADAYQEIRPENTVFLFRGAVPLSGIELVERSGFTVINPSSAVRIAGDKRETAQFLAQRDIAHPRLISPEEVPDNPLPVVAKPRFGSRGTGIRLIRSPKALFSTDTPYGEYIFQEYIATSHGRDFRVFFAFGSIIAAVERQAGNSQSGKRRLVSNTCTGGSLHPSPFTPAVPDSVASLIKRISEEAGLRYGAIDFLYGTSEPDPAHLFVCELNASPGFTALETEGGFNIAGRIMDKIKSLFFAE